MYVCMYDNKFMYVCMYVRTYVCTVHEEHLHSMFMYSGGAEFQVHVCVNLLDFVIFVCLTFCSYIIKLSHFLKKVPNNAKTYIHTYIHVHTYVRYYDIHTNKHTYIQKFRVVP